MEISREKSVGSFVAENYRAAKVFQKYGIDFCCRGGVSLAEASEQYNINLTKLIEELQATLNKDVIEGPDFRTWQLDKLSDYIVETHHNYIERTVPVIQQYLNKIVDVHGKNHPELNSIKELFITAATNLASHTKKEEMMLFPYIAKLVQIKNSQSNEKIDSGFWSVQNPVKVMMSEHDVEGERFRKIAELSNNYETPADGCRTYQVTFALLEEFEMDLHKHIHLENNILFPAAISLENELKG